LLSDEFRHRDVGSRLNDLQATGVKVYMPRIRNCCLAVFIMSISVLPGIAADAIQWGPTVSGLRISLSLSNETATGSQLQITIQNVSNRDVLVPLGSVLDYKGCTDRLRIIPTTPDRKRAKVTCTAVVALLGELQPLVIPLLSNASYTWRNPTEKYFVTNGPEIVASLTKFMMRPCQLQLELSIANPTCHDGPNGGGTLCWQGKLVSNVLQLPK
jgi:hypothetical protein